MKTIFDLGLHEGCDTDFYLQKGFRVVAVEANPAFVALAAENFSAAVRSGQLVIVPKAMWETADTVAPFFVRPDKDGWSSLFQHIAERDAAPSTSIEVETTSIGQLFAEFGVPHYLKCDIEGADDIVLRQVAREKDKPRFISTEAGSASIDLLAAAGYSHFQIINQGHLRLFRPPRPAREGSYVAQRFHGKMSGLFGEELDPGQWVGKEEIERRYARWSSLSAGRGGTLDRFMLKKFGKMTRRTWLIPTGWMDIHARLDGGGESAPDRTETGS